MRFAETINDVRELLSEYKVVLRQNADDLSKVYLCLPPTEEWEPDENQRAQIYMRQRPVLHNDPKSIQFSRESKNAIIELVHNPQFWRCTTVADQITRFWLFDGGNHKSHPPSKVWRIVRLIKRKDEPFTMCFESPASAEHFIQAIFQ